ncbi:MAG: hypothetical protein MW689_001049 [Thermodesulfobacteria bacterium]|nr:hypothetical protein [Thermodesulfobacteriota bacterium]
MLRNKDFKSEYEKYNIIKSQIKFIKKTLKKLLESCTLKN